MIKVTFIGAGSTVFMKNILTDILLEKNFSNCEIVLQDIDEKRLKTSNLVAEKVAKSIGTNPKIVIEKNQKKALSGADFVILMFQIGGYEPSTVIDFEIPAKYGLKQTIGDTLGIGGIMRGLRTVPALLSVAKDMNEVCPSGIMLQYVNPMAINCLALSKFAPELKYVGLCHSVQGTAEDLAKDIGEDIKNISYECSGINHMSFFTKFENKSTSTSTSIIDTYSFNNEKMSPFTGIELPPELWLKRPRRVLAFKIDNNLNARPQSGLDAADSVFEILVEGGMTRFLAFFYDKTSDYLGPIRSARPTDPTLIRPYGGILVVSGATVSYTHQTLPTKA